MFVSIKSKLISNVSKILVGSFAIILLAVAGINYQGAQSDLEETLGTIRESLIAKAQTLVSNNSYALRGMAEDNAFTAVQELVSSTVKNDKDISYGIYMDVDLQPWVYANAENPSGLLQSADELSDSMSVWAAKLESPDFKEVIIDGITILEFASPVIVDDEVLGFIRYGMSTASMEETAEVAKAKSRMVLIQTLLILVGINIVALFICMKIVRSMATTITNPIGSLNNKAKGISSGDYDSVIEAETNDEVGQLATAFDSMRVTIKKKIEDLATLNQSGEKLAQTTDKDIAYDEAIKTLMVHCNAQSAELLLYNTETTEWTLVDAHHKDSVTSTEEPTDVAKWVMSDARENQELFFIEDMSTRMKVRSSQTISVLIVPLRTQESLMGLICISGYKDQLEVSENDCEFAQTLARSLVITLNNINMREVIEEQNRTLEQKVEERTEALQEKTNDILSMMQNMHQGLFTIMRDGNIHHEYAAYCEEIFSTKEIAGRNCMDLLFTDCDLGSNALDQISTAISALVGEDEMMWDFNSHLLVTEYGRTQANGEKQVIELDWDPIILGDEIDKIMVTVRDVTALKALQAEAEEQRQELEIIGQILNLSESDFNRFIQSSFEFIDECERLIQYNTNKDLEVIASLFRNMHTVKGNARTYGLTYVTDSVHEVESTYDELRKHEDVLWNQVQLLDELEMAKQDVERYQVVARDKLGRSPNGSVTAPLQKSQIDELINEFNQLDTKGVPNEVNSYLHHVFDFLSGTSKINLKQTLSQVLGSLSQLAIDLNKNNPAVNIEAEGLFITEAGQQPLQNIFTHLLRNSLDHGIEPPEMRKEKGKPESGCITIARKDIENRVALIIYDDGAGLALHKLKEKIAQIQGEEYAKALSSEDIANFIFSSGVSTTEQVTDISGRGVGMEAVQEFIKSNGGDIKVVLDDKNASSNGFATFKFELILPASFYSISRNVVDEAQMV
ncbi:HAMP domain-containing protein [Marinibactrum halimedae]|uniref:Chemotaxis protein CheA n=1 Tax=Marinibactrum halimedae TaxID=1444977 RepID=A0AA37T7Y1_9GAMM|nr:HAMP domain-containing protein [Marinibactrum halimedae]MCD9459222.1 Hpt domain-containing protein [Marinibactrum halimedae]GLS27294.1 hypothetical protein GCM10007877_30130 [Marinibactrum halimedae]